MSFRKIFLLLGIVLILSCSTAPVHNRSGDSSVVVGSLKGTLLEPPRPFLGNSPQIGGSRGSVEFKGFMLIGRDNGQRITIRPLLSSFFSKTVPPGEYDLVRERQDRPSGSEDRSIRILTFTVPENSLVNLGTLELILEGPPDSSVRRGGRDPRGTYIYRYRYERRAGAEAMKAPLEHFFGEGSNVAAQFAGGIVEVTAAPTDKIDSSRLVLRERVFRSTGF